MYKTINEINIKSTQNNDIVNVPKGTLVTPLKNGVYVIIDNNVLYQLNQHDRKYRYLCITSENVEYIK